MTDSSLHGKVVALASQISLDKAELEKQITKRDNGRAQHTALKQQEAELMGRENAADDEATIRALTEVRVRLELIDRDTAKAEREIAELWKRLRSAPVAFCRSAGMLLKELEGPLNQSIRAAEQKARAPFVHAEARLSDLRDCLADSDYKPSDERDAVKSAERLLAGWGKFQGTERL